MLSCRLLSAQAWSGTAWCRWAPTHRPGSRLRRYPSDTPDAQWAVIDPLLPDPAWWAGAGGRPEAHCRRQLGDAIFDMVDHGGKAADSTRHVMPWSTTSHHFAAGEAAGVTQRAGRAAGPGPAARVAAPSAAVLDSSLGAGGRDRGRVSRGFDTGKKVNGGQQHLAVDTLGLLLGVLVTATSGHDRAGAQPRLDLLSRSCHQVRLVWADGSYAGKLVSWAGAHPGLTVPVVQRPTEATGFVVPPRRWVVARTLAWIARHRRGVRDYARLPAHHKAMVRWSMIRPTSRHLAKPI